MSEANGGVERSETVSGVEQLAVAMFRETSQVQIAVICTATATVVNQKESAQTGRLLQ